MAIFNLLLDFSAVLLCSASSYSSSAALVSTKFPPLFVVDLFFLAVLAGVFGVICLMFGFVALLVLIGVLTGVPVLRTPAAFFLGVVVLVLDEDIF